MVTMIEGTTGDLLLVSTGRSARCYCGKGLATCVIITVTVFNCGRGLACCFSITLEEVLLVVLLIEILLLWQSAEVSPHVLLLLSLCPCSRGLAPHPEPRHSTSHLCHTSPAPIATSSITLHHFTSLYIQHHLLHHNTTTSSALCHRHCLDRFLLSLTTEHIYIE